MAEDLTKEQLDAIFWGMPEARKLAEESMRNAQAEEQFYEKNIRGLIDLQAASEQRFAASRAPQQQAVAVLGQRAGTLEGGAAQAQLAQSREAAQARAMVAPRSVYGTKAGATEGAILGGAIGQTQGAQMDALAQEAAARQNAYIRSLAGIGEMTAEEAAQRRMTEAEILRDMQARFLAAQRISASKQQESASAQQRAYGMAGTIAGTILGAAVGGPGGAALGASLGGKTAGAIGG